MQLLAAGTVFAGKYEVVRTISAGGMGVVYEVIHVDTQRRRALKLMLPQILGDDDMRARFLREGLVTAKVESDHLVEVFDRGIEESSGAPYLVMELLRGEELAARVDRGERTAPTELLTMFEQVCAALDKTHAAGIVHRDLKPENLFVTRRDDGSLRMKILDFGIAKVVDGKSGSTKAVGTPLYMAPEQITGQARATRSETDFYAMAHIAFTVLVGRAYFEAEAERSDGLMGLMWQVHSGPTEAATSRARYFGVELPPAFDAWFARGTAKDPDARFHTGAELVAGLRAALDGGAAAVVAASLPSGSVVVAPNGPPASEPSSLVTRATAQVALTGEVPTSTTVPSAELPRSRAGLGVVAAGVLAIAALGAFLALRGGEVVATSAPSESGSAPAVTGLAGGVEPPASSLAIVPASAASSLASAFTPASSSPVASAPVVGGPQSTPGSRTGPPSNGATPPPSSRPPPIPTSKSTAAPAPTSLEWDGGR